MNLTRRLDEVATIIMGQAPSGESYNTTGDGLPLIAGAGDFGGGKLAVKKYTTSPTKISCSGDIILSIRASIGDKVLADGEYCLGRGVSAIRPGSSLSVRYLWHWLTSMEAELEGKGKGATFKQVNRDDISELRIPVLPIEDQCRIAKVLDQADELVAKRRRAISLLDGLAQSIFLDIFGELRTNPYNFPEKNIAELVPSGDRINYGVVQPGDEWQDGIPLIRVGDLAGGRVRHETLKRIDPSIERNYHRSRIRGNEILVACVGSIGAISVVSDHEIGFNIARAVSRIPIESYAMRRYIAEYLRTAHIQQYFRSQLRVVAQPTLNIRQLAETVTLIPPANLMESFTERVEQVDKLKSSNLAHLQEMVDLTASLQSRAFHGGVVRDLRHWACCLMGRSRGQLWVLAGGVAGTVRRGDQG